MNKAEKSFLDLTTDTKLINNSAVFSSLESLFSSENFKSNYSFILEFNEENILGVDRYKLLDFQKANAKTYKTNKFAIMAPSDFDCCYYDFCDESKLASLGNRIASESKVEYVYIHSNNVNLLYYKGILCEEYQNYLYNSARNRKLPIKNRDLNDLRIVFFDYRIDRFNRKNKEIVFNGYVNDEISEHLLRNDLYEYLKNNLLANVSFEPSTNKENDEESADIAVIDIENRVALIEVKYIIFNGGFSNPKKKKYDYCRFKAGYEQIDKYCTNASQIYKLHSAYLYMFYAGIDPELIRQEQDNYYNSYLPCASEAFKNSYKMTFLDNLLVKDVSLINCIDEV